MASARRQSNGRSPLVNKQSQITSFFSNPTPSKENPKPPSLSPNPNPNSNLPSTPSGSPATPSPLHPKKKRSPLIIPSKPIPTPPTPSYGQKVVDRRVRVYWPLDDAWYEGFVALYDASNNKHLVKYDDGEEELVDLGKEKIEWVQESVVVEKKKFKRLRRGGGEAVVDEKVAEERNVVVFDDDDEDGGVGDNGGGDDDDDSEDEDWGKNLEKEMEEVAEDDMDVELDEEEEEEEEEDEKVRKKGKCGEKSVSRKRKAIGVEGVGSEKKSRSGADRKNRVKFTPPESFVAPEKERPSNDLCTSLCNDLPERFCAREAEKLRFLGLDRRDGKRRRPGDPDYDSRTLYLPTDFVKRLSAGQRQWWDFKSKHMDKVLFFKMGKFYELFEMDAHVGAKELDLQYMKGEQPHCGFPEKNFSMNVEKLARKGYRVLVVEQTETPEQLELRRKEEKSKDTVVKREICAVVTKGTLTEGEMLSANPDASYLMAVTENAQTCANQKAERILGICLVDVATSKISLGQFRDDQECSALCCLLSELRPVEIIKPIKQLSAETERVLLTHTRSPLINELVPELEFWDSKRTVTELILIYKHMHNQFNSVHSDKVEAQSGFSQVKDSDMNCLPDMLSELVNAGEDGSFALSALGGAIYYLRQAFLDETLLRFASFESLPRPGSHDHSQKHLFLDAAALENLEIFENSRNGDSSGTLYAQLNHCVTASGKRLLKTWLARPLYNAVSIKERQDAIADFRGQNLDFALDFRKALSRLPDMERLLARIFSSSEACGRNASKVILYEDAAKKQQLNDFIFALRGCEVQAQACSSLCAILGNVESRLLQHLLTPGKGLPDIDSIINHFKNAFDWGEASDSGRIIPLEGVDTEYDCACSTIKGIESSLRKHLKEQQKLLGNTSITYVTVGKEAYLLEVPESLRGNVPGDYELRSSKKGYFRYWTPDIKRFLSELSQAESEKESALRSILRRLIRQFCEHHNKWRQLVSAAAELDVLISLAIASDYYEGPTCRPTFIDASNSTPCLCARSLGHPILRSDSLGRGTFVPNHVNIGGSGNASFILLTGPNMGGKSTLLRQVCLAVILAQVGADVPAESMELTSVDRIFVRMGAKDHIMAGQSTFLTELSETALMLSSATCNSLVALDELGRGTSTSDGQAIAESVLEHFVHKVRCRGMFSTHYHRLAVNYQNDPGVSLCHMACQVGGADGMEEVTFLYRLTHGACPKSYGVNVARLAGLPESVLQKAAAKSREFEDSFGRHTENPHGSASILAPEDALGRVLQKLTKIAAKFGYHGPSSMRSINSLIELQHDACKLLEEIN